MRKILIINIFGIGDVLFTTPLVKAVKANVPDAFIGYIGNARTAPMLEQWPLIDKVYTYDRDAWSALYRSSSWQFLKNFWNEIRSIRSVGYDLVIDLSMNASAGFLMWIAGIPVRLGFDYKGRGRFLNRKVRLFGYDDKHVVDYYSDLLKPLGWQVTDRALTIPLKEEHHRWAGQFIQTNFNSGQPVIVVVPGGGASWGKDARYKRWPSDHFAHLADKIIEKFKAGIILLGSREEKEICHHVRAAMHHPAIEVCDEPDVLRGAALMAAAGTVICNDGGPLHMAVAAGARTASIFGPVNEKIYGPYPPQGHITITHAVACRPCYRRFRRASCDHISCLTHLSVEEAFSKIERMLSSVTHNV